MDVDVISGDDPKQHWRRCNKRGLPTYLSFSNDLFVQREKVLKEDNFELGKLVFMWP